MDKLADIMQQDKSYDTETTKSYGGRGEATQPKVAAEGAAEDPVPELVSQEKRRASQVKEVSCAKGLRCAKQASLGNDRCW